MKRPRWLARFRAALFGYFWTPCPLCGQEFSGIEWADSCYATIPNGKPGGGVGICTDCWRKGLAVLSEPIELIALRLEPQSGPKETECP